MIRINKTLNRINLNLIAVEMGKDICIILSGGKSHLGAVTISAKNLDSKTFIFEEHKEHVLTEKLDKILKKRYSYNFVICCGIHFDNIIQQEIDDITDLSCKMIEELCSKLKSKG